MFGDEAEAAISRVMQIREQLRPYIMAQYAAAAASGTPIMRPLFVDFYNDAVRDEQQLLRFPIGEILSCSTKASTGPTVENNCSMRAGVTVGR